MGKPRYPYPADAVRGFQAACAATADQREVCACTIERLQSTLPYDEFASADRAIRTGQPVPGATRAAIDEATDACSE